MTTSALSIYFVTKNETNILAGFVEYNSKREIIFSIFLTLEVKSYLILINFWKIVRILMISEKSDLGTHSELCLIGARKTISNSMGKTEESVCFNQ